MKSNIGGSPKDVTRPRLLTKRSPAPPPFKVLRTSTPSKDLPSQSIPPIFGKVSKPRTPTQDLPESDSSSVRIVARPCTPTPDTSESDPSSFRKVLRPHTPQQVLSSQAWRTHKAYTPKKDLSTQLFPPVIKKVPKPLIPFQDASSESVPSSFRKDSIPCTPQQDFSSQAWKVPTTYTPRKDLSLQQLPPISGKVSRPSSPCYDVSSEAYSVTSSVRGASRPCTPYQDLSPQPGPSSFRKIPCPPDEDVSSKKVPASHRKLSRPCSSLSQSVPSSTETVTVTYVSIEPLDKNRSSSYSQAKYYQTMDAWETALTHSSKPTVNSAISWTDEELLSIEDSLSGFSTGDHPFPATMIFYVLCGVLCVLAATGTILLHSSLTTEAALWWLVCVAAGVVLHVLVLEPIKAVLILIYTSHTEKKLY